MSNKLSFLLRVWDSRTQLYYLLGSAQCSCAWWITTYSCSFFKTWIQILNASFYCSELIKNYQKKCQGLCLSYLLLRILFKENIIQSLEYEYISDLSISEYQGFSINLGNYPCPAPLGSYLCQFFITCTNTSLSPNMINQLFNLFMATVLAQL